ncbi:MAG: glycosyl hydrolase 115 family protein [Eubacteriales bacterium]
MKKLWVRSVSLALALLTLFGCTAKSGSTTTTSDTVGSSVNTSSDPSGTTPIGGEHHDGETVTVSDTDLSPVLYIDNGDYAQSIRAAGDLQEDFERVTGNQPQLVSEAAQLENCKSAVIIGTVGHSELIDKLVAGGALDVSAIEGQWEAYTISVMKNLDIGVENAIVIAGSDKRGTIYGIYELSEQIGVSPWYWWADVEIEHRDKLELNISDLEQTEMPDVKYRGIFINDEENFTNWSKQFVSANSKGTPNPGTYSHVFELLLRLKANTLWPAMHACSDAFNEYKNPKTGISYNAELADSYGIVMSASHCEMMLRDNEGEWEDWAIANQKKYNIKQVNGSWRAAYDYTVNADAMNAYWEERVAENYRFENIYMIGLRGVHDSGINCSALSDTSYKGKATVVKKAVEAQLKILEKYEQKYYEETGEKIKFQTAYCVYKEAAEYYKYDISLPSDCYLMYCDDNHGYVRTTPTTEELETYAGIGMYYHISYWGRPCSYLWVSNTPLPLIAEEMRKCYFSGMDDFWILNVGDIKPGEMKTEYFMDLAWDIDSHTENNTDEFTKEFLMQNLGLDEATSADFAATLTDFYQIMRNYVPEQAGKDGMEYDVISFGDEGQIVINKLQEICDKSEKLMSTLPEGRQDSYYELFHYTIITYLATMENHVYESMNHLCAEQGRYAAANLYAELSQNAYLKVISETATYNTIIAGGKWSGIINPYNSSQPVIDGEPELLTFSGTDAAGGVGLSGEDLIFGSLNDNLRFIDIYNKGVEETDWVLSTPKWMILTDQYGSPMEGTLSGDRILYEGIVNVEKRLILSVDWSKFTDGQSVEDLLTLTDGAGKSVTLPIKAAKTAVNPDEKQGYYEENGLVAIEAEHFNQNKSQSGFEWTCIDGLGRWGGSMIVRAVEGFSNDKINTDYKATSPYLEYDIYFTTVGQYSGIVYRLPTLNESSNGRSSCQIAWTMDDGTVHTLRGTTTADDSDTSPWAQMILLHAEKMKFTVEITEPGWHTFRLYMSNANMAVDRITLCLGGEPSSRLGIPETYQNITDWVRPGIGILPELSLDDINWGSFEKLYDFASASADKPEGYTVIGKTAYSDDNITWTPSSDTADYNRSGSSKFAILDRSFLAGSSPATMVLKVPADSKFGITIVTGDPTGAVKAAGMSVTCNGVKVLSNISTATGTTQYYIETVSDGNGLITLCFEGNWILNSLEIYTYTTPAKTGNGAFIPSDNKIIAIEAETALENSKSANNTPAEDSTKLWSEVAGRYGSALFFGPNTSGNYSDTSSSSKTAKLNYTVEMEAGKYAVWALVKCSGSDDDSVIFSIDGKSGQVVNDMHQTHGYIWKQITTYTVTEAGEHTLTVMGREDGFILDRILLVPEGTILDFDTDMNRAE